MVDIWGDFSWTVASMNFFGDLFRGILIMWPIHHSWDLSNRGSGSTLRALRISQLRTLSRSDTPWTLRKIPSLPLLPEIALFHSLPKIREHVWGSEKKRLENGWFFSVGKLPFCDYRALNLTQNCLCFTNQWINLLVMFTVTSEHHPKVLGPLPILQFIASYLQRTLAWFSGETCCNTSVFSVIVIPAWSLRGCKQYQIVRKK